MSDKLTIGHGAASISATKGSVATAKLNGALSPSMVHVILPFYRGDVTSCSRRY